MTRWKLTIEYHGAPYCGWQRQNGQPSVQEEVEKAIAKFCQQDVRVHAAGRTDTGVHATGQIAHFDLDYGTRPLTGFDVAKAINAYLRPQPIAILKAEEAADDFHARFNAINKLYRYRILNRVAPIAIDQGFAWHVWKPLDVPLMNKVAQNLLGTHDFTTFRDSECQAKSPVRSISRIELVRKNDEVFMEVEGRSFLHHQVRNMIGTLVMVGEGKWNEDDFMKAFHARDRTKGGKTAPADGLTLVRIDY